jgi:glycosyltransferase involved in cell wall biosynthesis
MINWFFKKKKNNSLIKKVLIVADKPNWAYDSIAKSILKYNNYKIKFDIDYIKKTKNKLRKNHKQYDLIFILGWQLIAHFENGQIKEDLGFLDKRKVITGIHSHHSWDNKKTVPNKDVEPPKVLIEYLNSFKAVNCVSLKLYKLFNRQGLNNLHLTENGVDIEIFTQRKTFNFGKQLNIGFSGNSQNHDWRKGVSEFIMPSTIKTNVNFVEANKTDQLLIPQEKMPEFYKRIDLYICASSSEGFSLSVLEACASGIPVISTKVGGCEDLIIDGYNGFLVEREIESIVEKINYFKENRNLIIEMGNNNRKIVEDKWCWGVKISSWLNFINNSI